MKCTDYPLTPRTWRGHGPVWSDLLADASTTFLAPLSPLLLSACIRYHSLLPFTGIGRSRWWNCLRHKAGYGCTSCWTSRWCGFPSLQPSLWRCSSFGLSATGRTATTPGEDPIRLSLSCSGLDTPLFTSPLPSFQKVGSCTKKEICSHF